MLLWTIIVATPVAVLAVFFEMVRRAPLMEETEHGLVYLRDERHERGTREPVTRSPPRRRFRLFRRSVSSTSARQSHAGTCANQDLLATTGRGSKPPMAVI